MEDDDTLPSGGEALSVEQAAAAYVKATTQEAPASQSEPEDEAESDTTDDELEASAEDGEEQDDGEPEDEEGQADEEDDAEPESDQGRFVASNGKVRLPDGTVSTVSDLINGNLRDRDYRQKTMEAAEVRKTAESKVAAVTQLETQLSEQRDQMVSLLKAIVPEAPPLSLTDPRSPDFDPIAYQSQKAQHEAWMAHLQSLEQQSQQTKQQKDEESAKARQEKGNAELATLVEKVPALKDEKRFSAFIKDASEHGAFYGFSMPELQEAIGYDHRMAMALRDAIQWRKLQASKATVAKKVEGRPPIAKGGKRLNASEHRARSTNDALTRLRQTGSVDDAAAAWLASTRK